MLMYCEHNVKEFAYGRYTVCIMMHSLLQTEHIRNRFSKVFNPVFTGIHLR